MAGEFRASSLNLLIAPGLHSKHPSNSLVSHVNADGEDVMRVGRRCFTSNLSWRTSWQDLKDAFRPCGNVVYCNIIKDSQGKN